MDRVHAYRRPGRFLDVQLEGAGLDLLSLVAHGLCRHHVGLSPIFHAPQFHDPETDAVSDGGFFSGLRGTTAGGGGEDGVFPPTSGGIGLR